MTGSVQKSTDGRRRLLLPICACEESRWGIGYARQLQRAGQPVRGNRRGRHMNPILLAMFWFWWRAWR